MPALTELLQPLITGAFTDQLSGLSLPLMADGPQGKPPGDMTWMVMLLFLAGMWFLLIVPQRKKQKMHDAMVGGLKSGDRVITTGGIYGTVASVKDDKVMLKIAEGTKVELNKHFVQAKLSKEGVAEAGDVTAPPPR